jgi:hypothetical protein
MKRYLFILIIAWSAVFSTSLPAQEAKPNTPAEADKKNIELTVDANRISVRNATVGQTMEIFSIIGLKMNEITMKATAADYTLNVPKGYYIIKIGETVRKIVIK